jgi:Ca2+-binding RTX toxin-like protein
MDGTAKTNTIYGGPGNDVLSASGQFDYLFGEEGDDTYQGGPGSDVIRDMQPHATLGSNPVAIPTAEGGADVAHGGGGVDAIGLGIGGDHIYGGGGDDVLDGEAGADYVSGGDGSDKLVGGRGFDRLSGGPGADTVYSGRWSASSHRIGFPFPSVPDDGPDRVSCGPGRDTAVSNPWDTVHDCEVVHLVGKK